MGQTRPGLLPTKNSRDSRTLICVEKEYLIEFIDRNSGASDALKFINSEGRDAFVCTNREIDEVALYTVSE
ncbi:MAG: hypothetical protein IJD21_04275 [Oscillospiraceae bacterium]|nr:hypothetical protein [Oscillospiraceae bacterium]